MSANSNKQPVAIVTGASSAMGLGIARALLERRYRVVANSRNDQQIKGFKAFCGPRPGGTVTSVKEDRCQGR